MTKVNNLVKKVKSYFPTALPVGRAEFEAFANEVIELVGNLADPESIKFALATMIMHLGPQRSHVPKNYFVRSLRKTASNQIAHAVMMEIKTNQETRNAAKAEDTATAVTSKAEPSDVEQQQKVQ